MQTLKEKFAAGSYQFAVRIRNHVILSGPVVILSAAEGSCFGASVHYPFLHTLVRLRWMTILSTKVFHRNY